jgi:hypothetical protein
VIANDPTAPLNPNQRALVGFSRFLEFKTAAAAQAAGGDPAKIFAEIGKRLVDSMNPDADHGDTVVDRLNAFLAANRAQQAGQ